MSILFVFQFLLRKAHIIGFKAHTADLEFANNVIIFHTSPLYKKLPYFFCSYELLSMFMD